MKTQFLIPLIAGIGLFCACKNRNYEAINKSAADSVSIDSTSVASLTKYHQKLVKKGAMRVKVKNVDSASNYITILTRSYNGMVMLRNMNAFEEGRLDSRISNDSVMRVIVLSKSADMTVKIPTENLEEFMDKVAHLGLYVTTRNLEISDKSFDYLASQLKLKNRAELLAQQKTGRVIIKNPNNVLALKDDMVDEEIAYKTIDDEVKNTSVTLNLYQSNIINREIIANDDTSAYGLPFFQRLWVSFENGWALFANVIVTIANLWVFMVIALFVWASLKSKKLKTNF